ncbi:MAG: type II toxin-antitoxin system HicB family antitoxin [Candidatus Obscuribacterales bacterium]|nr:type II toxin-antitoxin system HicB family antitoxin [Candidatus Obscuribacterales bacterium]
MSIYTIRYEKDETGWWIATVKEVRGCHTQGRTIEQARRRIREALGLFVDQAEKSELIDDVVLPANARSLLKRVLSTRKRAEEEAIKLQNTTAEAAEVLTKDVGVSVRDAGELLGLSHQRVHQLLTSSPRKKKAK